MAYGMKYQISWASFYDSGKVYIYEKDYVGDIDYSLSIPRGGLTISREMENWEQHIASCKCEIDILNDKEDYFELFDLLIATERKYRVVVVKLNSPTPYSMFEGFINTEAVQQRYLHNSTIRLVASNYLSKLEFVYPDSADIINNMTFIDIIFEILQQAGSETIPIYVLSNLISEGSTYSSLKSFMNQNGITNEIFWKNNVDREDSNTIIENILKSFECYMYYWDGGWYIESFDMLWEETKTFVRYAAGATYSPTSSGTNRVEVSPVRDVHELVFTEMSQTVKTTPGNRTVQVRIGNEPYYNLTVNDFVNMVFTNTTTSAVPPLRKWIAYNQPPFLAWENKGLPYKTMVNSVKRTSTYVNISEANNIEMFPYPNGGIYTSFRVTFVEGVTELSIKWKYSRGVFSNSHYGYAQKWVLNVYELETNIYKGDIYYDADNDPVWRMVGDPELTNRNDLTSADFDAKTYIAEVSINIPLSEVQYLTPGNYKMVFRILVDFRYVIGKQSINFVEQTVYIGDVQISASIEDFDENVIEGKSNTDFLTKKEITTNIADAPNYNYKTGVLCGDNLEKLTTVWYRNEAQQRKLVDYILIDKFRMGDVTRQQLTASLSTNDILRPFARFTESKQAGKKFLLTNIIHNVGEDSFEVVLSEYDNTTVIELNEV